MRTDDCSKSTYLGLMHCIFIYNFEDSVRQKCEWLAAASVMWERESKIKILQGVGRERPGFIDQFSVF